MSLAYIRIKDENGEVRSELNPDYEIYTDENGKERIRSIKIKREQQNLQPFFAHMSKCFNEVFTNESKRH